MAGRRQQAWVSCSGPVPLRGGTCQFWALFLSALQIEDETQVSRATQGEQDNYEMHVRAANIVSHWVARAGPGLQESGPTFGGGGGQTTSRETPLKRRAGSQLCEGQRVASPICPGEQGADASLPPVKLLEIQQESDSRLLNKPRRVF